MPPRRIGNPKNPWASSEVEYLGEAPIQRLEIFEDASRSILSRNDSPDLGFTWSVNPYRGCGHACAYCYARRTHEFLDFGAGSDFDRKIVIKREAPALLRAAFRKRSWKGEVVVFSGVTDCYQPIEVNYQLTRKCLEVCLEYQNPVAIITKAPLIERDLDLLLQLHDKTQLGVSVSIPIWDPEAARAIEPTVASPSRRMRTVERLANAGLDVGVNVAPLIPGISDDDLVKLLGAAADAGAKRAHTIFLRLPGAVATVFEQRLREHLPLRAEKVLARIEDARTTTGQTRRRNDPNFHTRMRGHGPHAKALHALFEKTCTRLGLTQAPPTPPVQPRKAPLPPLPTAQLPLFS